MSIPGCFDDVLVYLILEKYVLQVLGRILSFSNTCITRGSAVSCHFSFGLPLLHGLGALILFPSSSVNIALIWSESGSLLMMCP